ncbi:MAG: RluA family pseudouridine synthase [Bacteriovoracaceae bacterium]|nr:RluA family pseudouridine synthase [Bacteriovoracaceae bacterium]
MKDTKSSLNNSGANTCICPIDRNQRLEDILISLDIPKSWLKNYLNIKQLNHSGEIEATMPIDVLMKNHINPDFSGPEIEILFEDERFIAFDKPSGIHSHPLRYDEKDNCLSFLRATNKGKYLNVNTENYDRGLLFRLDQKTSGVLIYCKNENLRNDIFANRLDAIALKRYIAVVSGNLDIPREVSLPLKAFGKKGRKMVFSSNGDVGEMVVDKLNYNEEKDISLVRIDLKTGLRHQIRAQLSHLGFPILGDELYGGKPSDRMYLHSSVYQIKFEGIEVKIGSTPKSFVSLF